MSSVNIHCPRCQSAQVYRHGQNPKGRDRFRYRDCHRVFQLTYTYQARKPGMKELITEMAFNEPGMMLARMARLHGIQPCQLFKWKKQYRKELSMLLLLVKTLFLLLNWPLR